MLIHPQFDPVALQLGPVAVHWYGLTYLAAFALFVFLARLRLAHPDVAQRGPGVWNVQTIDDLLFYDEAMRPPRGPGKERVIQWSAS